MPDAAVGLAFELPPREALHHFVRLGLVPTGPWDELWQTERTGAFTVAHLTRLELIADIHGALVAALTDGTTFADFKRQLRPLLIRKGWWGPAVDPDTGEILKSYPDSSAPVWYGSPRRLETIYRTNLQTAYMAGRWRQQAETVEARPWWQYVAILDDRTRPAHAALAGKVFRADDPIWKVAYPPNGFRCRCRTRALSQARLEAEGLQPGVSGSDLKTVTVPKPNGDMTTLTLYQGPDMEFAFAPDLGWNYNPATGQQAALAEQLAQRLARLPADWRPAAAVLPVPPPEAAP